MHLTALSTPRFPSALQRPANDLRVAPAPPDPATEVDPSAPTTGSGEGDGLDLSRLGDLQQRLEALLARFESGGTRHGHEAHGHHEHDGDHDHDAGHDHDHDHEVHGEHEHGHDHHGRGARGLIGRIGSAVGQELRAIGQELGVLGSGSSDSADALRSLAHDFRAGLRDDLHAAREEGHDGPLDRAALAEAIRGRFATLVDGLRALAGTPAAEPPPSAAAAPGPEEPAAADPVAAPVDPPVEPAAPTSAISVRVAISFYAEVSFGLSSSTGPDAGLRLQA